MKRFYEIACGLMVLGLFATAPAVAESLCGSVVTAGSGQIYSDAVTLTCDTALVDTGGGSIRFYSTVDGAYKLTTDTAGLVAFGGGVGGSTSLAGLTIHSGTFNVASDLKIGGNLSITSSAGDIVQSAGAFLVGGLSSFTVPPASSIILASAYNMFIGTVSLVGHDVSLSNNMRTLLAASHVSGALTVTSVGDLRQTGALIIGGTATLNAGSGQILLNNPGNDFQASVWAMGADVALRDSNDLTIASLTNHANGNISLIAGDALRLPGGAISAGSGDLTLAANGDVLSIGSALSGNDVSLTGRDGVSLGAVLAAGTLTLSSTNAAIATGGPVIAGGNASVNAGTGAITLTNAGNDFSGAVSLSGGTTQIADANALTLGALDTGALAATSIGTLNLGGGAVTGNLSAISNNGAIRQSDALHVTGTSGINAGTGAIVLTDASNDFVGAVNLIGGVTRITDANALTLGTVDTGALTATSTGALNLGGGTVNGSLAAISNNGAIGQSGALAVSGTSTLDAGSGAVTLTDAGNDFADLVNVTGGTSRITDATALTLGTVNTGALTATSIGALNLGGGTVNGSLAAISNNGAIGQSGGLAVNGISTLDAGSGAITLANAGNDFIGSVNLTGHATRISDANSLALGTVNTGALTATSSGAMNLGGGTVSGDLQAVSSNGAINQNGALGVAGTSNVDSGNAAITLTNPGNDFVGAVIANGNGVSFTDSNDLAIVSLTGGSNGSVRLIAGGVLIMPVGAIDTGTGDLTLESNGGALVMPGALSGANVTFIARDGVTLNNDVTAAGVVSLTSGSAINQGGGLLTAGTLTGSSTGSTTLNGINHIGALGSFAANGFSLTNAQALTVNAPLDGGASVALTTMAGNLAINGAVSGTSATLSSAGNISEGAAGVITAGTLTGSSAGDTTLNGANHIDALGSFSAANFALTNAQALTASGPLSSSGDMHLATTSGQLNVGTNLVADDVSLTSAGDLALARDITATTVNLVSGGNLSQGAGTLTAATLTGGSLGNTTLNGTNHVGTLGSFSAADFALINAQALMVDGPVNGGTSTALTTMAGDLAINGAVSGTNTTLSSAGGISEGAGGVITAGTLSGNSVGDTTLTGANHIDTLGSFSAANFVLTDAQALTASGPLSTTGDMHLATTSGQLNLGTDLVGNDVSLISAGDLALGRDVTGTTVNLVSGGDLSQTGAVLTAGTLSGSSVGDTTLSGANHIDTLGSFGAANFALTNAQALTASGPLSTTGDMHLATTSGQLNLGTDLVGNEVSLISAGDLALGRDVTGTTVNLVSGGDLSQTGAVLTAGTLSGSSVGDTTLSGANHIGTLGSFNAAGFTLVNADELATTGPLTMAAGGAIELTVPGGAINGALTAAGGISIHSTPGTLQVQPGAVITDNTRLFNGTLELDSGAGIGAVSIDPGATLAGVGSAGAITNHGTVAPGVPAEPYGTLTVASYTAADNGAIVRIAADAASNSHAALSVNGSANLDGILSVAIGSSQPASATRFTALSAGAVNNTFASVTAAGSLIDPKVTYTTTTVEVIFDETFTVGGTISGLTASGLILQLNGGNDLAIGATDTSFVFEQGLHADDSYIVSVGQQPAGQSCRVEDPASGTIVDSDVSDVAIACETAQARLSLSIDDGRDYVRYGQIINYLVTLTNTGNATANVDLGSVLDAGLDETYTQWTCFGGDAAAQCVASGSGPLHDAAVVLPAGRTLTWLVSTPVQVTAPGDTVATTVTATPADTALTPSVETDTDTLVVLRSGFDVPYGDGSVGVDPLPAVATVPLERDAIHVFELAALPSTEVVDTQLFVHLPDNKVVSVESTTLGDGPRLRLLLRNADGLEVAGPWVAVQPGATLAIGLAGSDGNGDQSSVLLEGAASAMRMPLPD